MCEESDGDVNDDMPSHRVTIKEGSSLYKKAIKILYGDLKLIDDSDEDGEVRNSLLTDIQENRHDCVEDGCIKLKLLVSGEGKTKKDKMEALYSELTDGYFSGQPIFTCKKTNYIALWNLD